MHIYRYLFTCSCDKSRPCSDVRGRWLPRLNAVCSAVPWIRPLPSPNTPQHPMDVSHPLLSLDLSSKRRGDRTRRSSSTSSADSASGEAAPRSTAPGSSKSSHSRNTSEISNLSGASKSSKSSSGSTTESGRGSDSEEEPSSNASRKRKRRAVEATVIVSCTYLNSDLLQCSSVPFHR